MSGSIEMESIFIAATNRVAFEGLADPAGAYQDDATMTFSVMDRDGRAVGNAYGVSMGYVGGSDGNYVGVMDSDDAALLGVGDRVWLNVTIVASDLTVDRRSLPLVAVYRGEV